MKAVRFHEYGDSSVLAVEEVPRPEPSPGEVLIKVAAAGVNPLDVAVRSGVLKAFLPLDLPHVPCVEVSGTVVRVAPDVSDWSEGMQVVAFLPRSADGAAAEYVVAPADVLAELPSGVDPIDAAAMPAVALTAWQALFELGGLTAGQRVLINGAGGSVGGYAVQLAHCAGAEVTATASGRSADRVRGDGADVVIDYTVTPVTEVAGGPFDLVLNLAPTSAQDTRSLVALTADNGVFVTATTPAEVEPGRGVTAFRIAVRSDAAQLTDLLGRVAEGTLHIHVGARRPMVELPAVHAAMDRGERLGKVVIVP